MDDDGDKVKRCRCGRHYSLCEWRDLGYVGEQEFDGERWELRHCRCRSTLSLPLREEPPRHSQVQVA